MDLIRIQSDSEFQNAIVPAGKILTFSALDENGTPVTRYKDSNGNFGTLSGAEGGGGGTGEMEFYKCASVDSAAKTWTGYKAVLTDGIYVFEETVTSSLTYGSAFTPAAGSIYNYDAAVKVANLYQGTDPSLVFHAPLTEAAAIAETGQTLTTEGDVIFMTYSGRPCAYFNRSGKIVMDDISKLPFGSSPHTIAGWYSFIDSYQTFLFGYGYEYSVRGTDIVCYSNLGGAFQTRLDTDTWYHIVTTCDGSSVRLYLNGVFSEENTTPPDFNNRQYPELNIGAVPRTGFGKGYVSDVRVYNRCLSADEIADLAAL
jgi:hypothetical protein